MAGLSPVKLTILQFESNPKRSTKYFDIYPKFECGGIGLPNFFDKSGAFTAFEKKKKDVSLLIICLKEVKNYL